MHVIAQTPRTQETRVFNDMIAEKATRRFLFDDGFHLDLYQNRVIDKV